MVNSGAKSELSCEIKGGFIGLAKFPETDGVWPITVFISGGVTYLLLGRLNELLPVKINLFLFLLNIEKS